MANKQFFILCILAMFCLNAFAATVYRSDGTLPESIRDKREVNDICVNNTPCGWAIYKPFTRQVDFFMKNDCTCPDKKTCTRTEDDISVSAYVYRCQEKNRTKT